VAQDFTVQGQASPYQTVEVVAEYPPSKLPGYENYHDVVGTWHGFVALGADPFGAIALFRHVGAFRASRH